MNREEICKFLELADTPVHDIVHPDARAANSLKYGGIKTFIELLEASPKNIEKFRGVGPKTMKSIEDGIKRAIGDTLADSWMGDRKEVARFVEKISSAKQEAIECVQLVKSLCKMLRKTRKDWLGNSYVDCTGCPFNGKKCLLNGCSPKDWSVGA